MKILIDTCTFVWLVGVSYRVPVRVREAIVDPRNELYLSSISAWEIARKYAIGKMDLQGRPEDLVAEFRGRMGVESLPLKEIEAITAEKLPLYHRDPFDRMLIAQAILHGMVIATPDEAFARYPVQLLW